MWGVVGVVRDGDGPRVWFLVTASSGGGGVPFGIRSPELYPSVVISFGTADELVELVLLRRKSSSLGAASSSSILDVSGSLSRVEPQWEVTSHVAHRILWSSVISHRTRFVF